MQCDVGPQWQRRDIHDPHREREGHRPEQGRRDHDGLAVTPRGIGRGDEPQRNSKDATGGDRTQGPRHALDHRLGKQTADRLAISGHTHRQLRCEQRGGGGCVDDRRAYCADGEAVERLSGCAVHRAHQCRGSNHRKSEGDRDHHPAQKKLCDGQLPVYPIVVGVGDDRTRNQRPDNAQPERENHSQGKIPAPVITSNIDFPQVHGEQNG